MLVGEILSEGSSAFFRRTPQVIVGNSLSPVGLDFYLGMTKRQVQEQDKGTFSCPVPPDRFLVFRNPVRMTVGFTLRANNFHSEHRLRSYDRLVSYFFDHKSTEPFLPDSFRAYPGLYDRLSSSKAELRITDSQFSETNTNDLFVFNFDYVALYHSGNALREEQKAKHRVIDFNESTERSLQ